MRADSLCGDHVDMPLFRSKPVAPEPVKRVWRITQGNPLGEWVEVVPPATAKPGPAHRERPPAESELPEVSYGSWVTSSYDLLDGSDVTEDPDTIPGELLDDLFPQWEQQGKRPEK
jgi:hypothetical protein